MGDLGAILLPGNGGAVEYKIFNLPDVKMTGEGAGFIEGYASTFGNWDDVKERPVPGAFKPFLEEFLKDGFVALGHDWRGLPIGTPLEAKEDDHGLFVTAEFHSTDEAQKARTVITERLARGKSVKLSIGYEVLSDEFTQEGRLLKQVKLFEWSYVCWPANVMASVTNAKDKSPAGLSFVDQSQDALAAIEGLLERAEGIKALRVKEGRTLSAANVQRLSGVKNSLAELVTTLDDLLTSSVPEKEKSIDTHKLHAEFMALRLQALDLGVPL